MVKSPMVTEPTADGSRTTQTVLVVDDDPDILIALQDLLEFEGFHMDCVGTCREALSALEQNRYHAILLDLDLPDGNGQSILKTARSSDAPPPVIVLTATASLDRNRMALRQGAFAYVTKPYNRDELRYVVQQAIDRSYVMGTSQKERKN
jgi:DNA-binding response OmpR family regulator